MPQGSPGHAIHQLANSKPLLIWSAWRCMHVPRFSKPNPAFSSPAYSGAATTYLL
jgi:hypothetical protein